VKDIRLHYSSKNGTQALENIDIDSDGETDDYDEESFCFKQLVKRVDGLLLFKPNLDEPTEIINTYMEVLEDVIPELRHSDKEKCMCVEIILKSKYSWIVLEESKYWDAARTVLPIAYNWTGKREPCWLQHKYLEYSTQGHIYEPFDAKKFYDKIVDQTYKGYPELAVLSMYHVLLYLRGTTRFRFPVRCHHRDMNCACERYFGLLPRSNLERKIFEIESKLSAALDVVVVDENGVTADQKCWCNVMVDKYLILMRKFNPLQN
jgi:hypothetical protein